MPIDSGMPDVEQCDRRMEVARAELDAELLGDPCARCGGSGRVVVGEHVVTRDMALDAEDPGLEGMSFGPELGDCPDCLGTGRAPTGE